MKHEPASDRLIDVLREQSLSTHMQKVIARLDQERSKAKIARHAVRHAVYRTHGAAPDSCSPCSFIQEILETG